MQQQLKWLKTHDADLVGQLARLVAIPSISTDGEHQKEIGQTAELTCELMRDAGLHNVVSLRTGDSNPYAYGEWLGAPGKPTVFLYAHHDVQPVNFAGDWKSDPWTLTPRAGRLYGRGAADDKGAIAVQIGAISAYLKTNGSLPVNVKMLVEGEEEVGSSNLDGFFREHKDRLMSDVIVVCDTGNIETGLPCITYSLRGIASALVTVQSATTPVHSGSAGGMLADAAVALNVILARLYWKNGKIPIPGLYDTVRKLTAKEKKVFRALPGDEKSWRKEMGVLPGVDFATMKGVHPYEQTWRFPSATIIAQEASSIKGASNQVLPTASAIVSCRIVPDQDPDEVFEQLKALLVKDPPWGVKVTVKPHGGVKWWMTDPNGPAFEAAMTALEKGFGKKPAAIGCGGSIGFVGPLADLFGGAPALLLGIEDPLSNAHAPNESLHAGDFRKLTASLAHLFDLLGGLSEGRALKVGDVRGSRSLPLTPLAFPRLMCHNAVRHARYPRPRVWKPFMQAGSHGPTWHLLTLQAAPEVAGCINAILDALRPLDYTEQVLFGVRLALEEALVNAIRHGHRNDLSKTVHVRFQATEEQLLVEIQDEGPGFDPDGVPDPLSPENLERPGGRGVFLMRHYMTWVSFNEQGNCVTMCRSRLPS